jgi:hypothetical protein
VIFLPQMRASGPPHPSVVGRHGLPVDTAL